MLLTNFYWHTKGSFTLSVGYCIYTVAFTCAIWIRLTFFEPSNSERVASPGRSNIGAKRSKVWVGQEKHDKNAYILTVNISVAIIL